MLKICDFCAWLRSRYRAFAVTARQKPSEGREGGSKDQGGGVYPKELLKLSVWLKTHC